MDSSRDDTELAAALEELRPEPRPEFTAELDERAAAGFPRRSRLGRLAPRALFARLRATPPRKVLLPVGAAALAIIAVGAALVASTGTEQSRGGGSVLGFLDESAQEGSEFEAAPGDARHSEQAALAPVTQDSSGAASKTSKRSVERSAVMFIGTEPSEVSDAAAQIYDIVHANDGIVLSSEVSGGSADNPEGRFELLIPSGRLSDALASFSAIGEVLSRKESTADITAPTVGAAERLKDSRARIDSLLGQLADASSEEEREAVEAELRGERRRAARLRSRLADLKRRANLSRVSLRVVSDSPSGGWRVGDALEDAGEALAVAAAVSVLVLAGLVPIALLALLAWLAHRAWRHRARTRALG